MLVRGATDEGSVVADSCGPTDGCCASRCVVGGDVDVDGYAVVVACMVVMVAVTAVTVIVVVGVTVPVIVGNTGDEETAAGTVQSLPDHAFGSVHVHEPSGCASPRPLHVPASVYAQPERGWWWWWWWWWWWRRVCVRVRACARVCGVVRGGVGVGQPPRRINVHLTRVF